MIDGEASGPVADELSRLRPGAALVEVQGFAVVDTPERLEQRLPDVARMLDLDLPTARLVVTQLPGVARTDLAPDRAQRMAAALRGLGWTVRVHGATAQPTASATPTARVLGCERGRDVVDLMLFGDDLYVMRVGRATGPTIDQASALGVLHWVTMLYSKVGIRKMTHGHPDSSPDGTGAEVGRARMRIAATAASGLLGLDAANLRAQASALRARRVVGEPGPDDVVELHGSFVGPGSAEPTRRTLRLALAGDPLPAFERLLAPCGIRLAS